MVLGLGLSFKMILIYTMLGYSSVSE
jgi:hypothetical protein